MICLNTVNREAVERHHTLSLLLIHLTEFLLQSSLKVENVSGKFGDMKLSIRLSYISVLFFDIHNWKYKWQTILIGYHVAFKMAKLLQCAYMWQYTFWLVILLWQSTEHETWKTLLNNINSSANKFYQLVIAERSFLAEKNVVSSCKTGNHNWKNY